MVISVLLDLVTTISHQIPSQSKAMLLHNIVLRCFGKKEKKMMVTILFPRSPLQGQGQIITKNCSENGSQIHSPPNCASSIPTLTPPLSYLVWRVQWEPAMNTRYYVVCCINTPKMATRSISNHFMRAEASSIIINLSLQQPTPDRIEFSKTYQWTRDGRTLFLCFKLIFLLLTIVVTLPDIFPEFVASAISFFLPDSMEKSIWDKSIFQE